MAAPEDVRASWLHFGHGRCVRRGPAAGVRSPPTEPARRRRPHRALGPGIRHQQQLAH